MFPLLFLTASTEARFHSKSSTMEVVVSLPAHHLNTSNPSEFAAVIVDAVTPWMPGLTWLDTLIQLGRPRLCSVISLRIDIVIWCLVNTCLAWPFRRRAHNGPECTLAQASSS